MKIKTEYSERVNEWKAYILNDNGGFMDYGDGKTEIAALKALYRKIKQHCREWADGSSEITRIIAEKLASAVQEGS